MGRADGVGLCVLPPQAARRLCRLGELDPRGAAEARREQPALHDPLGAWRAAEPRLGVPRARRAGAAAAVAEEVPLPSAPGGDVLRHRAHGRDVLQGGGLDCARPDAGLHARQPPGLRLLRPKRQAEGGLGEAALQGRARPVERAGASRGLHRGRAGRRQGRDAARRGGLRVPLRRAPPRARHAGQQQDIPHRGDARHRRHGDDERGELGQGDRAVRDKADDGPAQGPVHAPREEQGRRRREARVQGAVLRDALQLPPRARPRRLRREAVRVDGLAGRRDAPAPARARRQVRQGGDGGRVRRQRGDGRTRRGGGLHAQGGRERQV